MQLGQVDFTIGDGLLKGAYAATVQGLTSAPALYGKPMVVSAKRDAPGSAIAGLDVGAIVDHRTANVRDSVAAQAPGGEAAVVRHPGAAVPAGAGHRRGRLSFALRGDQLRGRWAIGSNQVTWALDSAGGRGATLEQLVWRVVSGLKQLDVDAQLGGTIKAPKLVGREQPRRRHRAAAQGGGRRGGGQGRGAWPAPRWTAW